MPQIYFLSAGGIPHCCDIITKGPDRSEFRCDLKGSGTIVAHFSDRPSEHSAGLDTIPSTASDSMMDMQF